MGKAGGSNHGSPVHVRLSRLLLLFPHTHNCLLLIIKHLASHAPQVQALLLFVPVANDVARLPRPKSDSMKAAMGVARN